MTDPVATVTQERAEALPTPLLALHRELGGKLVDFAGYLLPVQYPAGIMAEHKLCRDSAALFDVSHMGQVELTGEDADIALERLVPGELRKLGVGRQRYGFFTNEAGGILDDLIVARLPDRLFIVVNAACKTADIAYLRANLPGISVTELTDRALIALQGPQAVQALTRHAPAAAGLSFLSIAEMDLAGVPALISRSGYSGEDGFEISLPADRAEAVTRELLAEPEVAPAGLGARDSLRLEAGLCLYGHDLTPETTPVEAGLTWAIGKRRRAEGGFPGAEMIQRQLAEGPPRRRVGLRPEGRAPVREGARLSDGEGQFAGVVTSGGFGPTVGGPVAMGYVTTALAAPGNKLFAEVRGKQLPVTVAGLPFVQQRYAK
ncbi:glycine cleavage system aminomethyltransferase GcvT [Algihabitans albus]|uniref:glycine cleavage system aminomethyltransferase GcvT n=1 Tax=Algihabitans albus TaxID=2164067 RepID=UPI000E5DA5B6|nr:glycine cleavage system aminomethyltransferase GcvT [Algihabitans albus]